MRDDTPVTLRPSLKNVLLDGRTPEKRLNIFQELIVTCDDIFGHYLPDALDIREIKTHRVHESYLKPIIILFNAISFSPNFIELLVAYRHHPNNLFCTTDNCQVRRHFASLPLYMTCAQK